MQRPAPVMYSDTAHLPQSKDVPNRLGENGENGEIHTGLIYSLRSSRR